MEENQRLMDNMVPRDIHEKYKRKLQSLQDRYKELLVKEAEVRTIRAAERDLPRKIQDYEYKYKNTVEELKKMEALRDLAEERASSCLRLLDERQKVGQRSDEQDIPTLLSNIDSLTFLVAEQKGKYATANVLLMSDNSPICFRIKYAIQRAPAILVSTHGLPWSCLSESRGRSYAWV